MEPKQYKAICRVKNDPFMGNHDREVTGYYVKHLTATPYPICTKEEHDKFVAEHTKHYIFDSGFSDWGLPTQLDKYEIDITTLEEVE